MGALGPRVGAKAQAGYTRRQRFLFHMEWAEHHPLTQQIAEDRARASAVSGYITDLNNRILAHPGGPNDPTIAPLHAELVARHAELVAHQNFLQGIGPFPVNPVPGCNPNSVPYPSLTGKPCAIAKIFNKGCYECFTFVFRSVGSPLNIGAYTERGKSYFALCSEVPDPATREFMLTLMVEFSTLSDLLSVEQIHMHDPDDGEYVNVLHTIGDSAAVRGTWIDRMHELTVRPPPGILPLPLPLGMTRADILEQSEGCEYWVRHLDYVHYLRAHEVGLMFCDLFSVANSTSSWYEVLERPQTNDTTLILTQMCNNSGDGIRTLVPTNTQLQSAHPGGNLSVGSLVNPWFMAIWRNQRAHARLIAVAPNIRPAQLCVISQVTGNQNWRVLIGYAAIQHMNVDGVGMLGDWADRARVDLTRNRMHSEIIDLITEVYYTYSDYITEIEDRYDAIMLDGAPAPVLPPGMTLQQAMTAEIMARQGPALNMLDILMNRTILYQAQVDPTSQAYNMTLVDTPEFTTYIRTTIERWHRSRETPHREARPLLNRVLGRSARITRRRG